MVTDLGPPRKKNFGSQMQRISKIVRAIRFIIAIGLPSSPEGLEGSSEGWPGSGLGLPFIGKLRWVRCVSPYNQLRPKGR